MGSGKPEERSIGDEQPVSGDQQHLNGKKQPVNGEQQPVNGEVQSVVIEMINGGGKSEVEACDQDQRWAGNSLSPLTLLLPGLTIARGGRGLHRSSTSLKIMAMHCILSWLSIQVLFWECKLTVDYCSLLCGF